MRKISLAIVFFAAIAANAQQRVFVSAAHGDDTNPCSVTLPCRSFAYANTLVFPNGEILVLDSGGYGPVTITQSVSIVSPLGVEGSVTQLTGGLNAITVHAPGSTVLLRGLSIFGLGSGNDGIFIEAASAVFVMSCNVTAFAANGIEFYATSPT